MRSPAQPDGRDYPDDNSNEARLSRWLVDQEADPAIRQDGADPVTTTGGELWILLYRVTDWAYHNGKTDAMPKRPRPPDFHPAWGMGSGDRFPGPRRVKEWLDDTRETRTDAGPEA